MISLSVSLPTKYGFYGFALVAATTAFAQAGHPSQTDILSLNPAWKLTLGLTLKESYDSNVFQQDVAGDANLGGTARPNVDSLVTSVGVSADFEWRRGTVFLLTAGYTPEQTWYRSASSENNTVHRVALNLSGNAAGSSWRFQNSATWADGSDEALVFAAPGGLPAMGGAAMRDRRDGFVERSNLKVTVPLGPWFVRPVATSYVHNALTSQRRLACYTNYIDRAELLGGFDLGHELDGRMQLVAGFRSGWQYQGKLHGIDSPFDRVVVHRFLCGVEGSPAKWLTATLLAGPESHRFAPGTPAGFDCAKSRLWFDASATITPGPRDVYVVALRRFSQPSSTSLSLYEDILGEISWRHAFSEKVSTRVGYRIARGDWQAPAWREDRVFTPNAVLRHALSRHFSYELNYSFDRGISRVPATEGRDFHRQCGTLLANYTF